MGETLQFAAWLVELAYACALYGLLLINVIGGIFIVYQSLTTKWIAPNPDAEWRERHGDD